MNSSKSSGKRPTEPNELPEAEADERFKRGIENALAMPPKRHKDEPKKREKR